MASYDGMLAAVRFYVTGFRDGHFVYSDDKRDNTYRVRTDGWVLDRAGDAYVVAGHNPEWQGPLPPLDAKLLGCDGRAPWPARSPIRRRRAWVIKPATSNRPTASA